MAALKIENLITDHLDLWTAAVRPKSSAGRGSNSKLELTGIKKLRELILELAVRGKLVPQDPSDEPASVLLERITAEKTRLVKEGKIKKSKVLPKISEEEQPFDLPEGWEWGCLGDIVAIIRGITFPASEKHCEPSEDRIACLRTANVQDKIEWDDLLYVKTSFVKRLEQRVEVGDIVMSMANSKELVGKVAYIEKIPSGSATFGGFLSVIRPYEIDASFLMTVLRAPQTRSVLIDRSSQTTNIANISLEKLNPLVIAIPPLPEQHRIVAKVGELMALCDQLELRSESQLAAHQMLVETLLATLTDSANADELAQNWARLSTHFDTLFTTEASIDALKQTILQLAVMGKLVPQDPSDEPASVLLERIVEHQAIRVKNKEIQKPKKILVDDAFDLELPQGWHSILLNDLVFVTKLAGFEYTKHFKLEDEGEVAVIRAQNVRPFLPDLDNLKFIDEETSLLLPRSALDRPALLVTFIGAGIGDVCVFDRNERWHLAPNVAKVEPYADLNLDYLCIYLNSQIGRKELFKSIKSTAQPSLSMTTIREIWVGLPPLAEQHRIASKVAELMALCDHLQSRLQTSQQTQLALAESLVEGALA
ncbi:restriction endonuclease subunit S [Aeromonas veronii]